MDIFQHRRGIIGSGWIAIVAFLLMVPAAFATTGENAPEPAKKIIAKVNGSSILESQLPPAIRDQLAKVQSNAQMTADYRKSLQMEILKDVIRSEIIYQESQKLSIPDIDTKIANQISALENNPMGTHRGTSDAQLEELAKKQIYLFQYLASKNLLNPEVPESEIRAYYEKNKQFFGAKEDSIHVRHILVQINTNASPEDRNEALKKIKEARTKILDGEDFAAVAKAYSEDNAASGGGDIGYIKRGYMPPEFDAVAFAQDKGTLSDIVETKFGYHLIEVLDSVRQGQIAPYEDLKEFFGKFLREQKAKKVIENHLQALQENAEIEIY